MDFAVIGDKEFALGFQLSGIKNVCLVDDTSYMQEFEKCFEFENTGIIIIEEKYFKKLPLRIKKKIEKSVSPVVVSLSEEEVAGADIGNLIKRCLGVDLWKE